VKALLVVGSAPCALEDLEQARKLYPDHEVMTVNGACTLVEDAEHMLAGHTTKAQEFVWARQGAFPDRPLPRVHANWARPSPKRRPTDDRTPRREFPVVTDWWGADVSLGATSAAKGAAIGLKMGFEVVVLCGCPMDGSGYHPAEGKVTVESGMQRVGDPKMQERATLRRYRDKMATLAACDFKGKVFSLSGFTRKHLGAPPTMDERYARPAGGDWLSA